MSGRIPTYMLTDEVRVYKQLADPIVLPAGSFIKPISDYYLPKHIKESKEYEWYDSRFQVYSYTHYGILLIDKKFIREV